MPPISLHLFTIEVLHFTHLWLIGMLDPWSNQGEDGCPDALSAMSWERSVLDETILRSAGEGHSIITYNANSVSSVRRQVRECDRHSLWEPGLPGRARGPGRHDLDRGGVRWAHRQRRRAAGELPGGLPRREHAGRTFTSSPLICWTQVAYFGFALQIQNHLYTMTILDLQSITKSASHESAFSHNVKHLNKVKRTGLTALGQRVTCLPNWSDFTSLPHWPGGGVWHRL